MKTQLKPKFYKYEIDNPYKKIDRTKAIFWKWEQLVFGRYGQSNNILDDYLLRGVKLLSGHSGDDKSPDQIPEDIKNADAPLEEKAFVAQMYSNELGRSLELQSDPSQIDWTAYFKD